MKRAFVTGGSGFLGRHLIHKLMDRKIEVIALARSSESAEKINELGAKVVRGDISDRDSLAAGMHGCDIVFHIAGLYKVGGLNPVIAEKVNVEGTRNVLETAHERKVSRIIYTSSVAVFGDTRGRIVDESYMARGHFSTEYERTKWLAHYEVAHPLINKGAPIIIVMPGFLYGPEDPNLIPGRLMRLYYHGWLPVLPGPDTGMTLAHVEDIAIGHILAADKGKIGESYILAGPAVTLREAVNLWSLITRRPLPLLEIPAPLLHPFVPILHLVEQAVPLPDLMSSEVVRSLGTTYLAHSQKARKELGWRPRSLMEGHLETFSWMSTTDPALHPAVVRNRQLAGLALISAAVLFMVWVLTRQRDADG